MSDEKFVGKRLPRIAKGKRRTMKYMVLFMAFHLIVEITQRILDTNAI
jgi:hypothetical protein